MYNKRQAMQVLKNVFFVGIICCLYMAAQAQSDAFRKGKIIVSAGTALGTYAYSGLTFAPPIIVSGEYGIDNRIGVGLAVSHQTRRLKADKDFRYSFTALMPRAVFHLTPDINRVFDSNIDADKFDIYAALGFGLEFNRWKYDGEDNSSIIGLEDEYDLDTRPFLSPVLGFRYLAKPHLGVFAECGRGGWGYLNVGVSLLFDADRIK